MKRLSIAMWLLWIVGVAAPAEAHLMPARQGTIHIVGSAAFNVIDVPAARLTQADDNHNGLIDVGEMQRHQAEIIAVFQREFVVTADGSQGQSALIWLLMPQTGDVPSAGSNYVLVMQRLNFPEPPRRLKVSARLFDTSSGMGSLSLSVRRGDETEMVTLSPGHSEQSLFRTPLETLAGFIGTGIMHILTGEDHLLFLLTIIVGLKSPRHALFVTVAFTIAHSLTLALSVLGGLHLPSQFVEPAIAASIILVALDNLIRGPQGIRQRVVIVFGCGLLHGMGFASAVRDFGLDLRHQLLSLAGFNIGVEIGQFAFIGALLSLLAIIGWLSRHTGREIGATQCLRYTSGLAASLGMAMLVVRLWPT